MLKFVVTKKKSEPKPEPEPKMGRDWDGVADKCCRGHYQPLLLLYANPEGEAINPSTAPQTTTKLPGYQYFNSPNNNGPSIPAQVSQPPAADPSQPPHSHHYPQPAERQYSGYQPTDPYNSDEEAGGFLKKDAMHCRQSSYMTAVDSRQGYPSQGNATCQRGRTLLESKARMVGGASSTSSLDALNEIDTQALPPPVDSPDYADWTLSNSGQYRRPQVINPEMKPQGQFVHPQGSHFPPPPTNTTPSLAKVNEIQRAESFKNSGGRTAGADLIRYQHAPTKSVPRCVAREQRKLSYRQYGSTHDLASQDNDSYSPDPQDFKSQLKRTLSAENMDRLGCDPSPVSHPAAHTYNPHFPYPAAPQRQRKNSLGALLDQWGDLGDPADTYISRKAVESVLSYQKKLPAKLPSHPASSKPAAFNQKAKPSLYQESLQVEIPDNVSLDSQRDSGYRSNSSCGDRSSASSISTASIDSQVIETSRGYPVKPQYPHYSHHRPSDPGPGAYGRQGYGYPSGNIETPPLPNKTGTSHPPYLFPGHFSAPVHKEEDPYDYLPCHQRPVSSQAAYRPPTSVYQQRAYPTSSHPCPANSSYQPVYTQSSGPATSVAHSNQQPVVHPSQQSRYSAYPGHQSIPAQCQRQEPQTPGVMQQAVGLEDLSQETKVYSRMKHNTCMLRSRSLQRRMVLRKDSTDGMDPDQTSLSSMSTDPDAQDLDSSNLEEDDGYHPKPSGGKHLGDKARKEAMYSAQYSSDSGYSSHSDYAVPKGMQHGNTEVSYGTLPKRGSHKPVRTSSISGSSDGSVYQAYINTQKSAAHEAAVNLQRSDSLDKGRPNPSKMSKDDIRQMLISEFLNKNKAKSESHPQGALHMELKDQLEQMSLKERVSRDDNATPEPLVVQHSRDSSTSSTHTLKAHSRENSMLSEASTATLVNQPAAGNPPATHNPFAPTEELVEFHNQQQQAAGSRPTVAPKPNRTMPKKLVGVSSFNPNQEIEVRTKNRRIQYVRPQTHPDDIHQPPRPSEVMHMDRQHHQQLQHSTQPGHPDSNPPPHWAQPMRPGQQQTFKAHGSADWSAASGGDCESKEGFATPTPTPSEPATSGAPSCKEEGLLDPSLLPPPPPCLMYPGSCTCDCPGGNHSSSCSQPRSESPLPPPPPELLAGIANFEISTAKQKPPVAAKPNLHRIKPCTAPKPPKSILKKKSKKSKNKMKKSISFNDNIALIALKDEIQDVHEEIDYVAYVQQLGKHMKKSHTSDELSDKGSNRTGYDSDFDDDTSDSMTSSTEANNESSHCNLCQKKMVEALEVYCPDCHSYMARFQPQGGMS